MKKNIAIMFFLLAAVTVIFLILYPSLKKRQEVKSIKSFEECVKAGYPIMESYPRQCTVPSGNFFVESCVGGE